MCKATGAVCDSWCWTDTRAWDAKCSFSDTCADCAPCSSGWSPHGKHSSVEQVTPDPVVLTAVEDNHKVDVMVGKGRSVSSDETAQCEDWCPIDTRAWELKCTMDHCKGCHHCAETGPACASWCWADTRAWDAKCDLSDACGDCAPCSSTWSSHGKQECENWCENDSRSWDTKCPMQTCHQCSMWAMLKNASCGNQ